MKYIEENIKTPIKYECDVLVAGGGFGGISAAIAAAREGKSVILADRGFMLGGLATAGLIAIYLPLCDGYGRQVSFGLADRLLRLSVSEVCDGKLGVNNWLLSDDKTKRGEKYPRFEVNFNPQMFAIHAEQKLVSMGVKLLYGTYVVGVNKNDDKISEVIAENKSGRFAISVGSVVDATGDADVALFADAPTVNFSQGNLLAAWYYSNEGENGYQLHTLGVADIPDEEQKKGKDAPEKLSNRRFTGLDGEEISEMCVLSHAVSLGDIRKRRENNPKIEPTTIATIPQIRMTRRIDGEYTLSADEMHKYFEDSIGMVSDWRKRGPVYEVPYRTLYSKKVKNLITAGRITSVTDGAWDIMRVIPCCAITGEAAGIAAAMTSDFSDLDVKELQRKLVSYGGVLHESDI